MQNCVGYRRLDLHDKKSGRLIALQLISRRVIRVNDVAKPVKRESSGADSGSKKKRLSRAEAVQCFLEAAIDLLTSKPVADISLQEISATAGLNYGYVYRYFGTRLDLFSSVTDELARLSLEAAREEIEQRRKTGESFRPLDFSALNPSWEYMITRIKVVQYLVSSGVSPSRFAEKSREITSRIEEQIRELGMNERMSRALAVRASLLFWAQESLMEQLGISRTEREDALALNLDQFVHHEETSNRLGWK